MILECMSEDLDCKGLLDTSECYVKVMLFFTKGYEENLHIIMNSTIFHKDYDEMVIVKDIEFFSLCEHHLVPFSGKVMIARIGEMFSWRLQVQERLTKQVTHALFEMLQLQGIAIIVESSHLCMVMCGVQKTEAIITISCMLGCLWLTIKMREEFLNFIS